jgi:hypothetical protein
MFILFISFPPSGLYSAYLNVLKRTTEDTRYTTRYGNTLLLNRLDLPGKKKDKAIERSVSMITIGVAFSNSSLTPPYVTLLINLDIRYSEYTPATIIKNLSKVPLKKNRGRNISMERITVNIFLEESLCRPIALNINQR